MTTVPLHYTVDGPADAPVLVLGSSLGTTGEMWAPQVETLSQRFRLVRYDHRGHGQSPVPRGPYSIAEMGADVLALLDRLDTYQALLGGLSLGGMVAMWVAAHAPDRVKRLALLCTSAQLGTPEGWADRAAMVRADGIEPLADMLVGRWLPPALSGADPALFEHLRTMLVSTPVEGYAGCCEAIGAMDLRADLPRITAPTLVISGLADEASPPEHQRLIAGLIPGARLAPVAGAAHLANQARPAEVGDLLADFLSAGTVHSGGTDD